MQRFIPAAGLALGLSTATAALALDGCPLPSPAPPPPVAGAAGAPQGGFGGEAGAQPAPAGAGGAAGQGGAGGAAIDPPLCPLAPSPVIDPPLEALKAKLPPALAQLGPAYGSAASWLAYREAFGSQTTLALVPPAAPFWTPAKVGDVRAKIGGGNVAVPADGCATCGLKSPCTPAEPPRVLGIAVDAPALPAAARAKAKR